jgi:hypothetical protein
MTDALSRMDLTDRQRIHREIGQGGMATKWRFGK